MSETPPPVPPRRELPRVKARLPFAMAGAPGGARHRQTSLVVYGVLTLVLIGVALYMAVIEQRPIDTPWVAAPAIGALWFALRLFMIWGSSNAR